MGTSALIPMRLEMKTDWKAKNRTKAKKLLEKTSDDFRQLHEKLFQLNYLASSDNDPVLTRKIQDLQSLVREALGIIRS